MLLLNKESGGMEIVLVHQVHFQIISGNYCYCCSRTGPWQAGCRPTGERKVGLMHSA